MKTSLLVRAFVVAAGIAVSIGGAAARQSAGSIALDPDDIGGVVTGAKGPEAGVWVIAETTDLPTRFARIVVTDDRGRYLVPDLPKANYSVWVRGYGLVDSAEGAERARARSLNLTAVPAPDRHARRRSIIPAATGSRC